MTDRERHLKVLEEFYRHHYQYDCGDYSGIGDDMAKAIQYAINSIKTDLKYDLLYEGEEIFTKADMVAMLTELKNKLIDKSWNIDMYDDDLDFECCYLNDIDDVIHEKINDLKRVEE